MEEIPGEELRTIEFLLEELSLADREVQRQPLPGFPFQVPVAQNRQRARVPYLGVTFAANLHLIPNSVKAVLLTAIAPFADLRVMFNK